MEYNSPALTPQTQLKVGRYDLFPTTVMQFDTAEYFDSGVVADMIQDIDSIIEQGTYMQINDRTPNWQSLPVLWRTDLSWEHRYHWSLLKNSFLQACTIYIDQVSDFVRDKKNYCCTGVRAWFYKHDPQTCMIQNNPWHDHSPSLLSGVFYLDTVTHRENSVNGTEFRDPRGAGSRVNRDVAIAPIPLGWAIFPGWMEHRTGSIDMDKTRYVIAADFYSSTVT